MTSFTTKTMPHIQRRKCDRDLLDYTEPPQVADRSVHAKHIVVSRSKFASAISTQGRNVLVVIWLAGWQIAIYDHFVERTRVAQTCSTANGFTLPITHERHSHIGKGFRDG